jgi:hypothetical protein
MDEQNFVVDDYEVVRIIEEWMNVNLTLHKDFNDFEGRVSLELMCVVLAKKLSHLCPKLKVEIAETDLIKASYFYEV